MGAPKMLFIGLLSGTSLDSIDVGLFEFTPTGTLTKATLSYPIPWDFKQECLKLTLNSEINLIKFGQLNIQAAHVFAAAVKEFLRSYNLDAKQITAIGFCGQNIQHHNGLSPYKFSIQIGDQFTLAKLSEIDVIGEFRQRDIANGHQGAPLAPYFHQAMFSDPNVTRFIVNLGGISNISILPANNTPKDFIGYDIGPANCLLDEWMQLHFNCEFDEDGIISASGTVDSALLEALLSDPYFNQKIPKSTGREYFNLAWVELRFPSLDQLSKVDVAATLLELTSITIAQAILHYLQDNASPQTKTAAASQVYLCGGGAHNKYLQKKLTKLLELEVETTAKLGFEPAWVEAGLFAWLAFASMTDDHFEPKGAIWPH